MAQNAARSVSRDAPKKQTVKSKTSSNNNKSSNKKTSGRSKTDAKAKNIAAEVSGPAEKREGGFSFEDISPYTNEITGIALLGIGVVLIACLFSDSANKNAASYLTAFLGHLFGFGGLIVPFVFIAVGILIFTNKSKTVSKVKLWSWSAALLTALAFVHIIACEDGTVFGGAAPFIRNFYLNGDTGNGGLVGALIGGSAVRLVGKPAACVICIILLVIEVILIFDFSVFNALKSLAEIMSYRNEEYDEDLDDEEIAPQRSAVRKRQPYMDKNDGIIAQYTEKEYTEDKIDKERIFKKRPERPVFEAEDIVKDERRNRRKKNISLDETEETIQTSPYHVDRAGRVVGIDLPGTRNKHAQGIDLYPAKNEKAAYDPNDEKSDINMLFGEDSEAEYDRILRETEDLFENDDDTAVEEETSVIQEKAEEEILPAAKLVETAAANRAVQAAEVVDTPPWEEPSSTAQIIKAEETREFDTLNVENTETYEFPKLEFLGVNKNVNKAQTDAEMRLKAEKLRKTLETFGVKAEVDNICTGPTVTRYELIPEVGTKVKSIINLEQDIALSLAATTVRIEAPIPGKSAIGIEIPNDTIQSVYYSEVLRNERFQNAESKTSFGIGKDIAGNVIVYDIAKAPHMLIAGATGAGKSVCINTLITSILYKATPDEVKLIMVDPKVVELSVYNGIPHLLIPVVTDPNQASGALNWAVSEMMRRYDLFAETGVRNLEGYNNLEGISEKLPKIIIIIDELADLMMVAKKSVEESICRIAQLARAAGMHLIIATQRPSVDVITGLIKANIPSRIAFKVSSGTDSRTVLDTTGAEKLLGRGDMLFKSVSMDKPLRIQGAFVTDEEVARIVDFIKTDEPKYDMAVMEEIARAQDADGDDTAIESNSSDELIDQVIDFVVRKRKASTSMIQRQFRIGFNRAGRIIDELEERGIIGPETGNSKPREVLMTPYERSEYKERHENY